MANFCASKGQLRAVKQSRDQGDTDGVCTEHRTDILQAVPHQKTSILPDGIPHNPISGTLQISKHLLRLPTLFHPTSHCFLQAVTAWSMVKVNSTVLPSSQDIPIVHSGLPRQRTVQEHET